MKCKRCSEVKLSKEFPPFKLLAECDHPPLHCLRCVLGHWEQNKTCSQCNLPVDESCLNLRKCYARIEMLFPEITCNVEEEIDDDGGAGGNLTLTRLNGESFDIPFNPRMRIGALKNKIEQYMKISPDKQNLMYKQNVLKEVDESSGVVNTLQTCGVKPNSTIHVMVLLYAVPSSLDKVVFDLYWGFPASGRDYLDACAWGFKGQKWRGHVRFYEKSEYGGAMRHSGDKVDLVKREGHQFINVDLHRIPSGVTHIFFTLSSYSSRTISHFRNPSMKFYEASRPDTMLCEDKTNQAGHRQAIVMCSLQRVGQKWCVFGQGALCDGDAKSGIQPILETIQGIIAKTSQYPYVPLSIHISTITDPIKLAAVNARR